MYCLDRSIGNCEQLLSNYRTLYEAYYKNNSCVLTSACMERRDEFVLYDTLGTVEAFANNNGQRNSEVFD